MAPFNGTFLAALATMLGRIIFILLLSAIASYALGETIDWSQPPAMCPEEVIPSHKKMAEDATKYLSDPNHAKKGRKYEDALTSQDAYFDIEDKVDLIYAAANQYQMPVQVLLGALEQESSLSDDGVDYDSGNYSCGMAQLSIREWCDWASTLNSAQATEIGWPKVEIDFYNAAHLADDDFCSGPYASPGIIYGFVKTAKKDYGYKVPTHMIPMAFYSSVNFNDAKKYFDKNIDMAQLQYAVSRSFLQNCADHKRAIFAKAFVLDSLYQQYVPEELKKAEHYAPGEKFNKPCRRETLSTSYPFGIGWLLADSMYNAGQEVVPALVKYKTKDWAHFTPNDLVSTLKTIADSGDLMGKTAKWEWTNAAHHIANVVNRASTRPILPNK